MEILSQMLSLLGFFALLSNLLPTPIIKFLHSLHDSVLDYLTPYASFEIPEFNGYCALDINDLYLQVALYLNSINVAAGAAKNCGRLTVSSSRSSNRISYCVAPNHTVHDCFNGHRVWWTHQVETVQDSVEEKRSFVLKIPKRGRAELLSPYIDHVTARSKEIERALREPRLFTNNHHGSYDSVPFLHPSTFETLALEPEVRSQIVDDLTAFAESKEFYRKIGRAWRRGYLVQGPPGSGKSSLIAAMANHLHYDVYDLELDKVADDSELRSLLIQTTNRSIVVIEDIDCSIDLTTARYRSARKPRGGDEENGWVTLSGLLSFTDGLWSCCGEERVIVFTTNRHDVVQDPKQVRYGRMDMHVSLGMCGAHALRSMVKNYLGLDSHVLFGAADRCLSGGALTPAQVAEILLRNRWDADVAMKAVVSAMEAKIVGGGAVAGEIGRENGKIKLSALG